MKIVLLGGKGESTVIMYSALKNDFNVALNIIEEPVGKMKLIKSRVRRLGYLKVINQLLFQLIIAKFLKFTSAKRIQEIKNNYPFQLEPLPESKTCYVNSINSDETQGIIIAAKPDIILVNGTRIISKKTLNCTNAIFINTHVGITPTYRGVHGGYWSLIFNDHDNFGVTVHLVDEGIDTGGILYQGYATPTSKDNFTTYPYLQYGAAVPILKAAFNDYYADELEEIYTDYADSKLHFHPTFTGYIYNRIIRGIK